MVSLRRCLQLLLLAVCLQTAFAPSKRGSKRVVQAKLPKQLVHLSQFQAVLNTGKHVEVLSAFPALMPAGKLSTLELRTIRLATFGDYLRRLVEFCLFALKSHLDLSRQDVLEVALVTFFDQAFFRGRPTDVGSKLIAAIRFFSHGEALESILSVGRAKLDVKSRGSWTSDLSLRRYSKEAKITAEWHKVPAAVLSYGRLMAEHLQASLCHNVRFQPPV